MFAPPLAIFFYDATSGEKRRKTWDEIQEAGSFAEEPAARSHLRSSFSNHSRRQFQRFTRPHLVRGRTYPHDFSNSRIQGIPLIKSQRTPGQALDNFPCGRSLRDQKNARHAAPGPLPNLSPEARYISPVLFDSMLLYWYTRLV